MSPRISVVLFNLGGPDSLRSVRPFLFNLFNDRAIIGVPQPLRWMLAQLISRLREKTATEIYRHMGGASPLVAETEAQRSALERVLIEGRGVQAQVVVAMRYWRPLTAEAAEAVKAFRPDHVVLLPLYPQFSTTTTGSSFDAWRRQYKGGGRVHAVCCYPEEEGFIEAHVDRILEVAGGREALGSLRVIFSAHGLPERVVAGGDPYQDQIERTSAKVAAALGAPDWRVSYQSRVGPLKWIGPTTLETLEEAGREGRGVVVVPIAFVSEHSETLVELDLEYREAARECGVPRYLRAPAIGGHEAYINLLASMALCASREDGVRPQGSPCRETFGRCPFREGMGSGER
jgi:ferrochelatase